MKHRTVLAGGAVLTAAGCLLACVHQEVPTNRGAPGVSWPDGWVAASDGEWIPVLDEAGSALSDAQDLFVSGRHAEANHQLEVAIAALRVQERACSGSERRALNRATKKLEQLSVAIEHDQAGTPAEVTTKMADVYQVTSALAWLKLHDEQLRPIFEESHARFEMALRAVQERALQSAADEIRRGAGFLRLAAFSVGSQTRSALAEQLRTLSELAERVAIGQLSPIALTQAFAAVDATYARAYLDRAALELEDGQPVAAGAMLKDAVERMRSRTQWLGPAAPATASTVEEAVASTAAALATASEVSPASSATMFRRARQELASDVHED